MRTFKLGIALAAAALLGAACTPGGVGTSPDGGIWITETGGVSWERRATVYEDRLAKKTMGEVDVTRLVFSPADSRKMFAITQKSGLWFSWNRGYFWDLILPNSSVADIAIHPQDSRRLYAAVGSSVALSIDEGIHWRSVYIGDSPTIAITSVAVNPARPQTIYAATNLGDLLISEDDGLSWRVHVALGAGVQLLSIQFHPQRSQTMYALVPGKGLARSQDSGTTWSYFEEAFAEFSGSNDPRDYALIPSGVIYASRYGLLRSLNHGQDWVSLPLISGPRDANIYSLAVNPGNPLEVYYGTTSTLYHSVDGGFNWIPRSLPTTRAARALVLDPENANAVFMGASIAR